MAAVAHSASSLCSAALLFVSWQLWSLHGLDFVCPDHRCAERRSSPFVCHASCGYLPSECLHRFSLNRPAKSRHLYRLAADMPHYVAVATAPIPLMLGSTEGMLLELWFDRVRSGSSRLNTTLKAVDWLCPCFLLKCEQDSPSCLHPLPFLSHYQYLTHRDCWLSSRGCLQGVFTLNLVELKSTKRAYEISW